MGFSRIFSFAALVLFLSAAADAGPRTANCDSILSGPFTAGCEQAYFCLPLRSAGLNLLGPSTAADRQGSGNALPETGIREDVPKEYRDRYAKWKEELLSTDFGRQQWEYYAANKQFLLTIVVSSDKKFGAGTDDYKWDDDGKLIAATITLGKNLDRGFPDPVYYPVMNSLAYFGQASEISGDILASAKFAHELGHVVSTSQVNAKLFQSQNKLMASYYKIFLNNGYKTSDPRLVDLAGQLGAEPIRIWEDREYWGEANAMHYLIQRINKEFFYCSVLGRIRRNVSDYAPDYQQRFDRVADANLPGYCHN